MTSASRAHVFRALVLLLMVVAGTAAAPASRAAAEDDPVTVHVETPLGDFDIRLLPDVAPRTVANFLDYVNDGDYENSFVHRSESGFVIQGGGFVFNDDDTIGQVPTGPAIANEFSRSNLRGTVAMAKIDGDPHSATSQWYINLADNSTPLDARNGGYTVFGEVVGNGMTVVDAIAAVPTYTLNNGLADVPLIGYTSGDLEREHMVLTTFTDTSTEPVIGAPPILLRNARNGSWRSYRLAFRDGAGRIEQKGSVRLPRSQSFEVVSRGDFDGDVQPDVLLRDTGGAGPARSGVRAVAGGWYLATLVGKKVTSKGAVDLTADAAYEVVSTDDFNRDGNGDVLLRDPVDDGWLLYRMDGKTILSQLSLFLGTSPTDTLVSTADFNADGRADFLLRHANGTWRLAASTTNGGYTASAPKISRSARYTVQAVADFDGDDLADVLVRNTRGRWLLYLLDGSGVRKKGKGSPGLSRDRDHALVSSADFNGDGKADALLRHADGSWHLSTLDGRQVLSKGSLEMSSDLDFEVAEIADFNGDRMADVLLRHATDGSWMLYIIDGAAPAVIGTDAPRLPRSSDWELQRD